MKDATRAKLAEVSTATLTTVLQPISSIAADAVSLLVSRMEGGTGTIRRSLLAPTLQLGESTGTIS